MNNKFKYDPENLEYLLLNKQYNELRETEKIYVLKHLSGPEEYAQMRHALLATVKHNPPADDLLKPNKHIKEELLQQFKEQRQVERMAWLNVLFAPFREWQPQLKIAAGGLAVAMVFVVGLIIFSGEPEEQIVENGDTEIPVTAEKTEEKPAKVAEREDERQESTKIPATEKSSQIAEATESRKKENSPPATDFDAESIADNRITKAENFTKPAEKESSGTAKSLGETEESDSRMADKPGIASSTLAEDEELIALLFTAM